MYKNMPSGEIKIAKDIVSRIISLPSSPQLLMKMKNLVIFGAGGHAESLIDIVMNHSIGKYLRLSEKMLIWAKR